MIPSAHPESVLATTLPSVVAAADAAHVPRSAIRLVDDGPEPRRLQDIARRLGVTYVYSGLGNAGGARNTGAAGGSVDLLVFVDDDVVVDLDCFTVICRRMARPTAPIALVGGLRPPEGSPLWLRWAYESGAMTPASALAPPGPLPPVSFATGLVALRASVFSRTGGFPTVAGIEDSLFGLALGRTLGDHYEVVRINETGGVHLYEPTWEEWLRRNEATGRRLRTLRRCLPLAEWDVLREAHGLGGGVRAMVKRGLGWLPWSLLRLARGRTARRAAAAAAEARGWRGGGGA